MIRTISLSLVLGMSLFGETAQAGILQTGTAEAVWPPFTTITDFEFDLFDPLGGNLQSVRLKWELKFSTHLTITNPFDIEATLEPLQRTFLHHGPLFLSDLSGGALYDLVGTDSRVLAPHETVTIEEERVFSGFSLDISNPGTLASFLGTDTAVWGIYGFNPQRENRIAGVAITPDVLNITATINMSIDYNPDDSSTSAVPVPSSLALLGIGIAGLIGYRVRRRGGPA